MSDGAEDTSRARNRDDPSTTAAAATTTSTETAAAAAAVVAPTLSPSERPSERSSDAATTLTGTATSTSASTTTTTTTTTTTSSTATTSEIPASCRTISYTGRRPRFGTGAVPLTPYIWIDGRQIRSALAFTKKWPPRRVSFPSSDTHLVTGYLEPANPWKHAENVSREDLVSAYKDSCTRHTTDPLESVVTQLQNLDITQGRCSQLSLKGEALNHDHCESLEEIFKRIQFHRIDLEKTSLNDESSVIIFDMLEYYESAKQLNISGNPDIGARGWQACSHMIKKTQCLEQLEAKDVTLNEQYMTILSRTLRLVCHLHVLKLENCGLSGRPIVILVTALKMNTGIRELYLADNGLDLYDAIQLGSLLRINNHVQLLDISNNNVQDEGVRDMLQGLINQVNDDKDGKGLHILILWNNRITEKSSRYFSRIITFSKTLETLNIGQNLLTSKLLVNIKDALKKNRTLLQLGMQSTELANEGMVALSEVLESNQVLQRIDLRDNSIHMTGMKILAGAMKENKSVTQIDLDERPRAKIDGTLQQYREIVEEIRGYCERNEAIRAQADESTEEAGSPRHYGRTISASSRKISLTCQTLPCSSASCSLLSADGSARTTTTTTTTTAAATAATTTTTTSLEPKRPNGGRLRSPAPSPIPSPLASPIPSPSRSRFVVSRVPEATLSSGSSSASSSPLTPPSLGALPSGCFFPGGAGGSSRFRVTVVEPAASANVTIGFRFKVDGPAATTSVTTAASTTVEQETLPTGNALETRASTQLTEEPTDNVFETVRATPEDKLANAGGDSEDALTNRSFLIAKGRGEPSCDAPKVNDSTTEVEEKVEEEEERPPPPEDAEVHQNVLESNSTSEKAAAAAPAPRKKASTVQRQSSSLEKLLSLFHHPGSFFSDSTASQPESKNPLQDGVNSMMALGDKFQQYLRDGKRDSSSGGGGGGGGKTEPQQTENFLQRQKSTARFGNAAAAPLASIQNIANIFASFKLESDANKSEDAAKSSSVNKESLPDVVQSMSRDSEALVLEAKASSTSSSSSSSSSGEEEERSPTTREEVIAQAGAPQDSINSTSDSNSSSRTLTCDIGLVDNVNRRSARSAEGGQDVRTLRPETSGNLVTSLSHEADSSFTCHVDYSPRFQSTTVNTRIDSVITSLTFKDARQEEVVAETSATLATSATSVTVMKTLKESPEDRQLLIETERERQASAESVAVPTVVLSRHESSTESSSSSCASRKESLPELDKSDTDDLIFCITDISNTEEDEPGVKSATLQSTMSLSPALEASQNNAHRNSQDSGIEESVSNVSEVGGSLPDRQGNARESFQESVDSGIDSESFSVGSKIESHAVDESSDVSANLPAKSPEKVTKNSEEIAEEKSTIRRLTSLE